MAARRHKISDEETQRWVEKYRQGESFSEIGRDSDIDRRIVTKAVRRFEQSLIDYQELWKYLKDTLTEEIIDKNNDPVERLAFKYIAMRMEWLERLEKRSRRS